MTVWLLRNKHGWYSHPHHWSPTGKHPATWPTYEDAAAMRDEIIEEYKETGWAGEPERMWAVEFDLVERER